MTTPLTNAGGTYQGYPYTSNFVIDAPSIDAETASKWSNLPRNQIVPIGGPNRGNVPSVTSPGSTSSGYRTNSNAERSRSNETSIEVNKQDIDEPDYTVYIDFPTNELGEAINVDRRNENTTEDGGKGEMDDRRDEGRRDDNSPEAPSNFVEDTIFYDPFEDRRINVRQNQHGRPGNTDAGTEGSSVDTSSTQPQAGNSSDTSSQQSHHVPPIMSKESLVYGRPPPQSTILEPSIPASQFPEPPPAYTEIAPAQAPQPPRTEVVVPAPSTAMTSDRKLITCPYCGNRVYTFTMRENGPATHVLGVVFIFVFAPLTLLVYCSDYFKYVNHYCPSCIKLVGYEVPMMCQDMVYTKI